MKMQTVEFILTIIYGRRRSTISHESSPQFEIGVGLCPTPLLENWLGKWWLAGVWLVTGSNV